jgi:hypothetical protein
MLSLCARGFPCAPACERRSTTRKIELRVGPELVIPPKIIYEEDLVLKPLCPQTFLDYVHVKEYIPPALQENQYTDNIMAGSYAKDLLLSSSKIKSDATNAAVGFGIQKIYIISDKVCPTCMESDLLSNVGLNALIAYRQLPEGNVWQDICLPQKNYIYDRKAFIPFKSSAVKRLLLGSNHLEPSISLRYPLAAIPKEVSSADVYDTTFTCTSLVDFPPLIPLTVDFQLFDSIGDLSLSDQRSRDIDIDIALKPLDIRESLRCFGVDYKEPSRVSYVFNDNELNLDSHSAHVSEYRSFVDNSTLFPLKYYGEMVILSDNAAISKDRKRRCATSIPYIPKGDLSTHPSVVFEAVHCRLLETNTDKIALRQPRWPVSKLFAETPADRGHRGIGPVHGSRLATQMLQIKKAPYFYALDPPQRKPKPIMQISPKAHVIIDSPPGSPAAVSTKGDSFFTSVSTIDAQYRSEHKITPVKEVTKTDKVEVLQIETKSPIFNQSFETEATTIEASAARRVTFDLTRDAKTREGVVDLAAAKPVPVRKAIGSIGSIGSIPKLDDTESRVQRYLIAHSNIPSTADASADAFDVKASSTSAFFPTEHTTSVGPVDETMPLSLPKAVSPIHTVALATSEDDKCMQGLTILVTETMLDSDLDLIMQLQSDHGLSCVDASIDDPINFIVDVSTGIAMIDCSIFDSENKDVLRNWLFLLTKQAFKYDVLWVIVVQDSAYTERTEGYFKMRMSFMAFPCTVCLRQCVRDSLAFAVFSLCRESSITAAVTDEVLLPEYIRNTKHLYNLADHITSSRSEFIQQFPTINLHLAISILSVWPMRQLLSFLPEDAAGVCKELGRRSLQKRILSFLTLIHCYAGSISSHA